MKLEIRLPFSLRRRRARPVSDGVEPRDSAVDALVERADEVKLPELDGRFREPPWEDRRVGFRRNAHN